MIQGDKNDIRNNSEGYADPTAYQAIRNAITPRQRVKNFLWGYLKATRELERIENEIKDLEEERDMLSVKMDGMPRGSDISDRTGNLATKIADMYMKAINQRAEAWNRRQEVVDVIHNLNKDHSKILYDHFVKQETFEHIADEMGYSFRHLMRLYDDALKAVGRKMS